MYLPAGVSIIDESQYDADGIYQIRAGHTHIFKFKVPSFSKIEINLTHFTPNSQDGTLIVWFSEEPLDKVLFANDLSLTKIRLQRRATKFVFWDSYVYGNDSDKIVLPSNKDFFINILNQQNSMNGYRLTFGEECPCDIPS